MPRLGGEVMVTKKNTADFSPVDPDDGLPIMGVGTWAFEKHRLLAHYVGASYGVRQRNSVSTLIDLYCGPGRVYDRDNPTDIRDGGVVAAYRESTRGKSSNGTFSHIIIGDVDSEAVDACAARLNALGAKSVHRLYGPSTETVNQAISLCPSQGLKLAYLDPYKPEDLPFYVLSRLASKRMIDFVVYYGQMDVTRNIAQEYSKSPSRFDDFAPGWKSALDLNSMRQETARSLFFDYWLSLMQNLGFKHARQKPLMTLDINNAPLYRMVLFSSHSLAQRLWDSVAKSPQGELEF